MPTQQARILPWNMQEQKYCTFHSHQSAAYRAAEEIVGTDLEDESADVVSLGKIMYTVLTVRWSYLQVPAN